MKGNMNKQKFRRNLLKQWRERVKEQAGFKCEYCNRTGKGLNCHHIVPYATKGSPLKYDPRNGILLCCGCHKYNSHCSAHKGSLVFYHWFEKTYLQRYNWILLHYMDKVDLDDETVLLGLADRLLQWCQ